MIPSKIFSGVHFVLLGFDSISQQQIRSRMVDAGGVDGGRYSPDCTHVIVDKVVYDDPICVAARSDGKTLVTALWVYHSFDVGMLVDPALIMYRPLRDLNGIPGANSLVVCLTGYQGHERDDIMDMVGLMGANFSKPLVANKVTHLICYKFEGMKYDLAKQIKRVKLVNHRWLEDCLRTWQILPEDDYNKSGYELDMMEAQAKDSEDEAQDMDTEQRRGKCTVSASGSPSVSKMETKPEKVPSQEGTPVRLLEVPGSFVPGTAGKICSELNSMGRTPLPENVTSDFISASKADKKSPSPDASMFTALSYSRKTPRKAILPVESVQTESKAQISVIGDFDNKVRVSDSFNLSSCKMDADGTTSNDKRSPLKEILSCPEEGRSGILSEKRKVTISPGSSKLQRTDNNLDFSSEGVVVNRTEECAPEPSKNELLKISGHSSGNKSSNADTKTDLSPLKSSPAKVCSPKASETGQICSKKASQISSEKRKITHMDRDPEVTDLHFNMPENAVNGSTRAQNGLQDEAPPPETKVHEVERCNPMVGLDFPQGEASTRSKPLKRKLLAKKTLGSRPGFGRGKALNQKGSIQIKEKGSVKNHPMSPLGQNENEEPGRFISTEKVKVVHPTFDAEMDEDAKIANVLVSGNEETYKTRFVDDETEATDNVEKELRGTTDNEKPGDIDAPNSVPMRTGEKVGVQTKQPADNIPGVEEQVVDSGDDKLMNEPENAAGKKNEQSESLLRDNAKEVRINSGSKFPSTKTMKRTIPVENFGKGDQRKEAKDDLSGKKAKTKKAKGCEVKVDKDIMPAQVDMADNSMEMEKENTPLEIGCINVNNTRKKMVGISTRRSNIKPQKNDGENSGPKSVGQVLVKTEPNWFILSGHKLQRKDFRQVIQRLKGRVCRDSHQWSYQATHFIVPDPIRRTEKFFAAAASGRWILKSDYLSASNEAGKFLSEEPYEWHKKGMSEDGAINLEAPRKWRLLREKTGHGAFYGMRIIIYGECIAPPLDTLKRVVKAGDGTILATSPPYTRFLQSGVDFAIVSSGMPRVDIWVQEFLRNEIPCVLADYLVDYVCKPGYSLDRHVQYNTLAWAEKSLNNLATRMEEVVEDPTSEENDDDITCQVCGSRDRGEVMLICGDESGSSGCGIGTHIDCCDPPLEAIPEEDWFCSSCRNRNSQKARKNSGKPISRLKRK